MAVDPEALEQAMVRLDGSADEGRHGDEAPDGREAPPEQAVPAPIVGAAQGLTQPILQIFAEVERLRAANRPPDPSPVELLGRYALRGRVLIHYSQARLSDACGVSQSAISRLERGRGGGMPVGRLLRIANQLGNAFPLGYCPHRHRCRLQPHRPAAPLSEEELIREQLVALGLDLSF
jgi:transcriptional regulator with XRE-family HTH domain